MPVQNTGVLFIVETLEFMRRGGRIGGAAGVPRYRSEHQAGAGNARRKDRGRGKGPHQAESDAACASKWCAERIKGKGPIRLAVDPCQLRIGCALPCWKPHGQSLIPSRRTAFH